LQENRSFQNVILVAKATKPMRDTEKNVENFRQISPASGREAREVND